MTFPHLLGDSVLGRSLTLQSQTTIAGVQDSDPEQVSGLTSTTFLYAAHKLIHWVL